MVVAVAVKNFSSFMLIKAPVSSFVAPSAQVHF
jgi:hypothetical protein